MDINYVLSLDDEPVFSEASADLRRPVLPGIEIQQYKKVGSTQQTLDLIDPCEEDDDTDEDEVHPFYASPPVLPRPIPTGQPTWIAATSDPVYRAAQLAQERRAEADALQVHTADHGTQLESIRSYLNSEACATAAASVILRPMNGPHGVDANGKPLGLPDDFCEEGFEPCSDENTIPHTQQPQSGHPTSLSSTPGHPPHPLPPNESPEFDPAVNQSTGDNVRQSERQAQPPTTQDSGNLRRIENRSLRSTWDSDLRTPNTFSPNHSIYQTRQAQATLAAPPGPPPALGRQPAQLSPAAEETEDVGMAEIEDGSDDDLYEMTDKGWKVVHSGPYPDTPQQPEHISSGISHPAGYDSLPSNQYLRPLAPRPPQPECPATSLPSTQAQHQPSNFAIYQDQPRPSFIQRFPTATLPRSTLPLTTQPSQSSTPRPPAPQNTAATHLPCYALGDAKSAVQARKYITLDITDAPCTRCVAKGQACYRSERGTYWKCAYCQTLRGGRREECVLHG